MSGSTPRRAGLVAVLLLPLVLVVAVVGRMLLGVWADITVTGAFYDGLGMGAAYARAWHTSLVLGLIGLGVCVAAAATCLLLIPGKPRFEWSIRVSRAWGLLPAAVALPVLAVALIPAAAATRDTWLAARNAVAFGRTDPVYGRDVGFYVFELGLYTRLAGMVMGLAAVMLVVVAATAVLRAVRLQEMAGRVDAADPVLVRARRLAMAWGGVLVIGAGIRLWLQPLRMMSADRAPIAGPNAAERAVAMPAMQVWGWLVALLGLALVVAALPGVAARARRIGGLRGARIVTGAWLVAAIALVVVSSPWWIVLGLVAAGCLAATFGGTTGTGLRQAPVEAILAGAGAVTLLGGLVLPGLAARLYDQVALRGNTISVERNPLTDTIAASRDAAGIADLRAQVIDWKPGAVTPADVKANPQAVGSVRFLDYGPVQQACLRIEARNRYYTCADVDLDRYVIDGTGQTRFVIGREVDYARVGDDFTRRHLSFTHGRGIVMAPVNRIDAGGRPSFVVSGLPVRGLRPPLTEDGIYFGANPGMPWAMVNTGQADGFSSQPIRDWSGTGIPVSRHRLAITVSLGGLPFVGGRRIWNATGSVAKGDAVRLLMYRDLPARLERLVPFLGRDGDPYFVAAEGRLYVMQNVISASGRYPYALRSGRGVNYARHSAVAVMDAYSGQTRIVVLDDREPILATWRRVYPSLFSSRDALPPVLAAHLRYSEDVFAHQAAVLSRVHVTDINTYYNGDQEWSSTTETVGGGAEGTRITSPARYTYATLPGQRRERFSLITYFKPAVASRGIGFAAWLAVGNDPGDFGRLTLLSFDTAGAQNIDSVDTFVANVNRDQGLSSQLSILRDKAVRGNVIVVPVGKGLLYVQPLYLDSPGDSLPTLWQVVVSFGDGKVYTGPGFAQALQAAFLGTAGAGGGTGALPSDVNALVIQAQAELEAHRKAYAAGRYEEAARHMARMSDLLSRAADLAGRAQAGG